MNDSAAPLWLLQGNPKDFDINGYLASYPYIYWTARQHARHINVGDQVMLWRAGASSGVVASGIVREAPTPLNALRHPEYLGWDLWTNPPEPEDSLEIGIELDDVRLDEIAGMIPRDRIKQDAVLMNSQIIKNPRQTVFATSLDEAASFWTYWIPLTPYDPSHREAHLLSPSWGVVEGERLIREHCRRERSSLLIERKKAAFAAQRQRLFCEICDFKFDTYYPPELGNDFIEVHHLRPLSSIVAARVTTLDELMLVCSNCHQMIHRTKDIDSNLRLLLDHFRKTSLPSV